jgi:hypothetical protein
MLETNKDGENEKYPLALGQNRRGKFSKGVARENQSPPDE